MTPTDFHFQDCALIVEALAQWAGNPNELETPREERAWELIEAMAAYHGVTQSELIEQIDDDWSGE